MGHYATDGKCHNAQYGSYGHECGKPATWLGTIRTGWQSGYCDRCKAHGDEARDVVRWERRTWARCEACGGTGERNVSGAPIPKGSPWPTCATCAGVGAFLVEDDRAGCAR